MKPLQFPLAPMSADLRFTTAFLLLLPAGLAVAAFTTDASLALLAGIFSLLYAAVWLFGRPVGFAISDEAVEILWPLRRRRIPRARIVAARVLDRAQLREEAGLALRVGAGGLWGGFGWLWSRRRGWVHLYVSTTAQTVWLDCGADRPWLVSPASPHAFLHALAGDRSDPPAPPR